MKNFINSLRNDQSVTFVADFGGLPVPTVHRPWEPGCYITVPSNYQPCFAPGPYGGDVPFVPVEVVYPDGDHLCDKLFLGTLTKMVRTSVGNYIRTRGTVVDAIHEFSNWDDVFKYALAGRTFVITEDIECEVTCPRDGSLYRTHVYQFDFVNDHYPLGA